MKITLAIPTNADMARLEKLKYHITKQTFAQEMVDVLIIDNGNTFGRDLTSYLLSVQKAYRGSVTLLTLPERVGLTSAWKAATDASLTDWTVLVNDDTYFMPAWDATFIELINRETTYDCYLLCEPYNWSGFAVNKKFIKEFPWRTEFPAGYHEDDDLFLRVASARGLAKKSEVYSKEIYCLPYNESSTEGKPRHCFSHEQGNDKSKKSKDYTRWNDQANLNIFNKYWQEVSADTPGAIENKNERYFLRK